QHKSELKEYEETQRLMILERLGRINVLYLRDYKQAVNDYSMLLDHYPKTDEARAAHIHMADVYRYKLGEPEEGIDQLQLLISKFPGHTDARRAQLEVIRIYLELKNFDQARMESALLQKNWPESAESKQAQLLTANSYYIQNRFTEAIASYEMLLTNKPGVDLTALVHFELASCYQELGEYEKALNYYYSCLPQHSNPKLVQEKIERVRKRLRASQGRSSIYIPSAFKPIRGKTKTSRRSKSSETKVTKTSNRTPKAAKSKPNPENTSKSAPASTKIKPEPQKPAPIAPSPKKPAKPAPTAPPAPKAVKKVETKAPEAAPSPKKPANSPSSAPSN
ncbi:MAG: tetratricopeptide repeat protein, partial [Deltaproteobacteria bacterium]|nr:tetratricopeptide repeat protein [Deltaproteobacteria bacterium]